MNIDEALRALCEKHGLELISLHVGPASRPYANVHHSNGRCELKWGETASDAISSAIRAANENRFSDPEAPALEIGEIEA